MGEDLTVDIITYALCKKQIADAIAGAGVVMGKSAYEIAVENGYSGTQAEWLESLRGEQGYTPYIGEDHHWYVNGIDTGVAATVDTVKVSAENADEIVVDSVEKVIYAIEDSEKIAVAELTRRIEDEQITVLFE